MFLAWIDLFIDGVNTLNGSNICDRSVSYWSAFQCVITDVKTELEANPKGWRSHFEA